MFDFTNTPAGARDVAACCIVGRPAPNERSSAAWVSQLLQAVQDCADLKPARPLAVHGRAAIRRLGAIDNSGCLRDVLRGSSLKPRCVGSRLCRSTIWILRPSWPQRCRAPRNGFIESVDGSRWPCTRPRHRWCGRARCQRSDRPRPARRALIATADRLRGTSEVPRLRFDQVHVRHTTRDRRCWQRPCREPRADDFGPRGNAAAFAMVRRPQPRRTRFQCSPCASAWAAC